MFIKRFAVLSLITLPVLVACAGSAEPVRRPPSYAAPIGVDNYEVHCGASRVIAPYYSVDIFFNEDGTEKTREQFCEEYRSDTMIRP